jgi:hypothetical protein
VKKGKRPDLDENRAAFAFYRVTADDLVAKLCDLTGYKPLSFTRLNEINKSLHEMRLFQLGGTRESDKQLEVLGYMISTSKFIQVLEGLMNGDELAFLRRSFENSSADPLAYLKAKGVTSAAHLVRYYEALTERMDQAVYGT